MHKLTIDCDPISYNDRGKLCHALIAEGYSFEENNEKNIVTVLGASLSRFPYQEMESQCKDVRAHPPHSASGNLEAAARVSRPSSRSDSR